MIRHVTGHLLLTAALACAAACGCWHPNPVDLVADIYDPPKALLNRAFLDDSADVRREGIVEMSHRWWGLGAKALKGYARIARAGVEAPTVRGAALRAMAQAGDDAKPHVKEVLAALADRKSTHVRWDAAVALDSIPDDQAVKPLTVHVKWDSERRSGEPSPDVRTACARALRHYRKTEVVAALAVVLEDDEDYAVRREAHESLVRIVGVDRGWNTRDWQADAKTLPALPPRKPWWDPLGLTVKDAP